MVMMIVFKSYYTRIKTILINIMSIWQHQTNTDSVIKKQFWNLHTHIVIHQHTYIKGN